MNKEVYKHRAGCGMATYNIINGEFGDNTLHLRDTSCTHSGPKCEIEVEKCNDGDCYQFSKALNWTAEEHISFHKLEKFWATKEEAYIEYLQYAIKANYNNISVDENRIKDLNSKLSNLQEKEVCRFRPCMAKLGATCYVENAGTCKIIGVIYFADRRGLGYLTDSNYDNEDRFDSYGGDRIILIETDGGIAIETEAGDIVYNSESDFKNSKVNKEIKNLKDKIDVYQRYIDRANREIKLLQSIFDSKDSLTYEQMLDKRQGK